MNIKVVSFLTSLLYFSVAVATQDIDWSKFSKDEVIEMIQIERSKESISDLSTLTEAKHYLVNGEAEKAKKLLQRIDLTKGKLRFIAKRYLSLIAFIEEDYEKSLEDISSSYFYNIKYYAHICVFKILNQVILKKRKSDIYFDLNNCLIATDRYSNNDHVWLKNLIDIKYQNPDHIAEDNLARVRFMAERNDVVRIWLKLGIYLNLEHEIVQSLGSLSYEAFQSKTVRELVGFIYYRLGRYQKAFEYIEDLTSSNAENIKGNIYLKNNKYELAYGHFKLALREKYNSQNALERSIPLAWLLGLWQDGQNLLRHKTLDNVDIRKLMALDAGFKIRNDELDIADKQLAHLSTLFRNKAPIEVDLMRAYTSLMLKKEDILRELSDKNCKRADGLSCWLKLQQSVWMDFSSTIRRDEETNSYKDINLSDLKTSQDITPINENLIIDQSDIEELDSMEIKLTEVK